MRYLHLLLMVIGLVGVVSAEEEKVEQSVVEYVQELTGKLDALTQTINALEKRIEILETASHVRGSEDNSRTVDKVIGLKPSVVEKPKRSTTPPASADRLWGDGRVALQHKNFDEAEKKLSDLVHFYPEYPEVPEAYYWLGEMRLINHQYAEAQTYYALAYKVFPETNVRKAEVGLKIAECYFALNKRKEGCLFLKEIMKLQQRGANVSSATLQLMEKHWGHYKCAE